MKDLIQSGIRKGTRKTYSSAQRYYLEFCTKHKLCPLPASEETVLLFVSDMYLNKFKYSSVRVYLAAVRLLHVEEGFSNPLEGYLRVKQAVRAFQINASPQKQKLPITLKVLQQLYKVVPNPQDVDIAMEWAAMSLAFYACLRASEFTVRTKFDHNVNITMQDVKFHSYQGQEYMSVLIKRSKTDVENKGFIVNIPCVSHVTCAVCAMRTYLQLSNPPTSLAQPLFQYKNGMILTNYLFQTNVKLYIAMLPYPPHQFSGHSFRIGCATTAAAQGFMDWEIKALGRWSSNAYQRYIRTPISTLLNMTSRLVSPNHNNNPLQQFYQAQNPYPIKPHLSIIGPHK